MTGAQVVARKAANGMLCFIFSITFLMLTSAVVPWPMLGLFAGCGALTFLVINRRTPAYDLAAHFGTNADFIASVLRGTDANNCDRLLATYTARVEAATGSAAPLNDLDSIRQLHGAEAATCIVQDAANRDGDNVAA